MYKHLLYTWLLSAALYPIGYIVAQGVSLSEVFSLMSLGLIFSTPAALLLIMPLRLIMLSDLSNVYISFLLWLCAICLLILLVPCILFFSLSIELVVECLEVTIPGMIAATIAALIRLNQFRKLFYSFRSPKRIID